MDNIIFDSSSITYRYAIHKRTFKKLSESRGAQAN